MTSGMGKVDGKTDVKTENKINDSSQEREIEDIERNLTNGKGQKEVPVKMGGDAQEVSRSRKRKRSGTEENELSPIRMAKKQKVLLEVPKISPISGEVFVIGMNECGQLGFEEYVVEKVRPSLLDLQDPIVDIAAGGMHSVCLTANGDVITFGCNDEGALGRMTNGQSEAFNPDKVHIDEQIIQISAGDSHSAALSESGHVYIWGNFRNKLGRMGLVTEGREERIPIRILNDITIVKISSGCDHLACLSQEGIVYTIGNAEDGQLGRDPELSRETFNSLFAPKEVPIIDSPSVVNNIWTGSWATFLKSRGCGSIYAFGLNNYGQLGLADPTVHAASYFEVPLLKNNIYKPVRVSSFANRTWLQVSGGLNHTLALDDNGVVYSLGRSDYGRLGLGEGSGDKSVPTVIPSLQDKKCVYISCGDSVSFAVTDNGSAFSWGFGTNYQLGHGDDSDQYSPKLIEDDSWKAVKISGGGQHTLLLAQPREYLEKGK